MHTLHLTQAQFEAVRNALDQFVENGTEAVEYDPTNQKPFDQMDAGAQVLDEMNAKVASLAEMRN